MTSPIFKSEVSNITIRDEEPDPIPKSFFANRIFMNQIDQYNARHIAEYITDQIFGALEREDDIADEGMEEEFEPRQRKVLEKGNNYEIIGTNKYPFSKLTEDISFIVNESEVDLYLDQLLKCSFVIYDITNDHSEIKKALGALSAICSELDKVRALGPKTYEKYERSFVFVLISTVMTWGNSKPLDPDDPEAAYYELGYKKRKPHPNYLDHISCEREVIAIGKKYKNKLKTYVVCCGILYGYEENDLLFLFRMAWMNPNFMPLFQGGSHIVPFLHVHDLAQILHKLLEIQPKKKQYILAVEQNPCTFKEVIKAISKTMGNGRVKSVSKEEAFLYPRITQQLYDRLTVNLRMEPTCIVDDFGIEFKSELNIAENMKNIVKEFRLYRSLTPFRILMHGPPGTGKTLLAKEIAEKYGVHYFSVQSLIEEYRNDLQQAISDELEKEKRKGETVEEEVVEEEEDGSNLEELQDKLRQLEMSLMNAENGRLPDDQIIALFKEYLQKNNSQNQGYILDGYPKTIEQAKALFGGGDEDEDVEEEELGGEDEEGVTREPLSTIMPMHVFALDASDTFVCNRIMNLPEDQIELTHYSEERMLHRLNQFRLNNTQDETLLNFFDEHEIYPSHINVEIDDDGNNAVLKQIEKILGLPIGFELSEDEQEELLAVKGEEEKLKAEQLKIQNELLERERLEYYQIKMEEKIRMLEDLQMEEEKLLAAQCDPLRSYLMKYIFPTLTEGLLEVARVKPNDPVDYLAEYLFKCNPEGKMFDPAYTRHGEQIENVKD